MGDESRWDDHHPQDWGDRYRREAGPGQGGGQGQEWRGEPERRYGAGDYERSHAPQNDWPRYASSDAGREHASEQYRGGGWPAYTPGRDSPDYNDRGAWRGHGEWAGREFDRDDHRQRSYAEPRQERSEQPQQDFAGWDAPFGGKPIHQGAEQGRAAPEAGGFSDKLRAEGRSFIDRAREEVERARDEVVGMFGGRKEGEREGSHRGRGPRGYRRSDMRIQEDVNDRLTDDSWLDASDIEVAVRDAEVTLTGKVRSRDDKRRAEDLAERVAGVMHVQNNLRVDRNEAAPAEGRPW